MKSIAQYLLNGLLLCCLLSFSINPMVGFGQKKEGKDKRCGFVRANRLDNPLNQSRMQLIEKQIQQQIAANRNQRTKLEVIEIPTIVHIIHQGEAIGTGTNIEASRIYAQIEALNEDFRKQNADLARLRSMYTGLAGDASVEFKLATKDALGNDLPEPGIVRHYNTWTGGESGPFDELIKKTTYFDPYKYMNIWVAPAGGTLLGVAQLPKFTTLEGLEGADQYPDETDGVWVSTIYFGASHKAGDITSIEFSRGRTLTHEVGHWLGLLHIWGDGGCGDDDFVTDTPRAGQANYGCPAASTQSCTEFDLWENFMDYTDDSCMAMFSQGQVDRMRAVLDLDKMRQDLIASGTPVLASLPSTAFTAAVGYAPIREICANGIISFRDLSYVFGSSDAIQSISWQFEGGSPSSSSEGKVNVQYNTSGSYDVVLTATSAQGTSTLVFTDYITVYENPEAQFPLAVDFEQGLPSDWGVEDAWKQAMVGKGSNNSFFIDHFRNDYSGTSLSITSPLWNVSRVGFDSLAINFDVAYAEYASSQDSLELAYQADCDSAKVVVWAEGGAGLATTTASTNNPFEPSGDDEWKAISLKIPIETKIMRLYFTSKGDYGHPIYIDNINIEGIGNVVTGTAQELQGEVTLFPNPSEGQAQLTWEETTSAFAHIRIVDLLGREVYINEVRASEREHILELQGLPAGTYLLQLRIGEAVKTKKLLMK